MTRSDTYRPYRRVASLLPSRVALDPDHEISKKGIYASATRLAFDADGDLTTKYVFFQ